jgi:hypothetical protein
MNYDRTAYDATIQNENCSLQLGFISSMIQIIDKLRQHPQPHDIVNIEFSTASSAKKTYRMIHQQHPRGNVYYGQGNRYFELSGALFNQTVLSDSHPREPQESLQLFAQQHAENRTVWRITPTGASIESSI